MISIGIATKGLFPGQPIAIATRGYFGGITEVLGEPLFIITITHEELHAITLS